MFRNQARPLSLLVGGEERGVRVVDEETTRSYGLIHEDGNEVIVRVPAGKQGVAGKAMEAAEKVAARRSARGACFPAPSDEVEVRVAY